MGDCGPLIWVSLGMIAAAAVAAWFVGKYVGRMRTPDTWVILGAIIVSLVVLQGGARLAVIVKSMVEARGLDPLAVCGGALGLGSWVGTLLVIIGYVGAFFVSFRVARKGAV